MELITVLEILNDFVGIVLSAIYFISKLPSLLYSMINFIPDPFKTNLLIYFPIMFGLFIWKLVRG